MTRPDAQRVAELTAALAAARERLRLACAAADRAADEVELLVVTKFFPASDVLALVDLGCSEFGESREPEAGRKAAEVRAEVSGPVAFDMIGRIQRRKAKSVARWADRVHSIDTDDIAGALDSAATAALDAGERDAPLEVLLQVSLDDAPDRGGVSPVHLEALADRVETFAALHLAGLMVIAPQSGVARDWMARAAEIRAGFLVGHPDASEFSAGMSGDLDEAVAYGSTCVRVGTAIMGSRPILSPKIT